VAMQFYLVADMFPLRVWNAFGCFTETKMEWSYYSKERCLQPLYCISSLPPCFVAWLITQCLLLSMSNHKVIILKTFQWQLNSICTHYQGTLTGYH
jgi:hypothetical protein